MVFLVAPGSDSGARKPCEGDTATTGSRFLLRGTTMEQYGQPHEVCSQKLRLVSYLPLDSSFIFAAVEYKRVVTG